MEESESSLEPETKKPKKLKRRRLENKKEQFRKTPEWREFRTRMATLFDHKDYITGRKLGKGYNVHHLKANQDAETYCDISNESHFIPLNAYSHKLLHYLFGYYKKDKAVLTRLKEILDKMCILDTLKTVDPMDLPMEELLDESQDNTQPTIQQEPNVKEE